MPRYQTSWRRFWAAMVDGIVFVPFSFLDDWLLVPGQSLSVLVIWATFSYSSYWLYSVVLHARLGKRSARGFYVSRSLTSTNSRFQHSFRPCYATSDLSY
jgi:hypothetical protein